MRTVLLQLQAALSRLPVVPAKKTPSLVTPSEPGVTAAPEPKPKPKPKPKAEVATSGAECEKGVEASDDLLILGPSANLGELRAELFELITKLKNRLPAAESMSAQDKADIERMKRLINSYLTVGASADLTNSEWQEECRKITEKLKAFPPLVKGELIRGIPEFRPDEHPPASTVKVPAFSLANTNRVPLPPAVPGKFRIVRRPVEERNRGNPEDRIERELGGGFTATVFFRRRATAPVPAPVHVSAAVPAPAPVDASATVPALSAIPPLISLPAARVAAPLPPVSDGMSSSAFSQGKGVFTGFLSERVSPLLESFNRSNCFSWLFRTRREAKKSFLEQLSIELNRKNGEELQNSIRDLINQTRAQPQFYFLVTAGITSRVRCLIQEIEQRLAEAPPPKRSIGPS